MKDFAISYHGSKPLPSNSEVIVEEISTSGIGENFNPPVLFFVTEQLQVEKHNKASARVCKFAI
jgi:hypothetical protein